MTKKRGRKAIALLIMTFMILSLIPNSIYAAGGEAGGNEPPPEPTAANVWAQEFDGASGTETEKRYEINQDGQIRIEEQSAGYNQENHIFESFVLKSETADVGESWTVEGGPDNDFSGVTIEKNAADKWQLHMDEAAYDKACKSIKDTGMYEIPIKYQPGAGQEGIAEKAFGLVFTGMATVTYQNLWDETKTVDAGGTIDVTTVEGGTFTCGTYPANSEDLYWTTAWSGGEEQNKPIWIGSQSGKLSIEGEGTVEATVKVKSTGQVLCTFTVKAANPVLADFKIYIDNNEITDSYTVAGKQWKTLLIKGKMEGSDKYVPFSEKISLKNGVSMTADQDFIICPSWSFGGFTFDKPGKGNITVTLFGVTKTFEATSTYVPIDSVTLNLPETVLMHRLVYSMGSGDNYMGLNQSELNAGLKITPENSSYSKVEWSGDNDPVANYFDTHNNGFIAHKEGNVTITASIDDNGKAKSASQAVAFQFEKPVEGVSMKDGQTDFTVEEEEGFTLPLAFTPDGPAEEDQPSQTAMKWTYDKEGIVKIRQSRGQYDHYTSKTFELTANAMGTVKVTGTPLAAKEGVEPVTFTVTVTESTKQPPDSDKLVNSGLNTCQSYYSEWQSGHETYGYNDEWDIIALKRAGFALSEDESAAIASYRKSIEDEIAKGSGGRLHAGSKPTDLARVALALYAIGENPAAFGGFDFLKALANSSAIESGSNEAIWALIAMDAKNAQIPSGVRYDREKLLNVIMGFQNKDGGFGLSKGDNSTVDMTAMAVQALSKYQNRGEVKACTDKALAYLQEIMDSKCDFGGTSEAISQAVIAISSLGKDITLKENGFIHGRTKNVFTALAEYRHTWPAGFAHTVDGDVDHMATQQALMAYSSWKRVKEYRNSLYDMTDVAGTEEPLPEIAISGLKDKETLRNSKVTAEISAGAAEVTVRLNGKVVKEQNGKYLLKLNLGSNQLSVRAVSKSGAVSQLVWTVKYSPLNYQKDIGKKLKNLSQWAKEQFGQTGLNRELLFAETRRTGISQSQSEKLMQEIQDGNAPASVDSWTQTILIFNAMGMDSNDIHGKDLWSLGAGLASSATAAESAQILAAMNSSRGQKIPSSISKEALLAKVKSNENGGFGQGASNAVDTANAVIAFAHMEGKESEIEKAVEWLAENQAAYLSDVTACGKVLTALSEVGIDFTLDDRFCNEKQNLWLTLKASAPEDNQILYTALSSYERCFKNQDALYDLNRVVSRPGLTATDGQMIQAAAEHLKKIDFKTYSPQATEAAYLLVRDNQATAAVYDYLDVLKAAVKENKIKEAKDYFFAGLYLKESGVSLSDVDGTDMLRQAAALEHTGTDSFGGKVTNMTDSMAYTLLTLDLEPKEDQKQIRDQLYDAIEKNKHNYVAGGICEYWNAYGFAQLTPKSTAMGMMALAKGGKLPPPVMGPMISLLAAEDQSSMTGKICPQGYWADRRKDRNTLTGNLETTADILISLYHSDVDARTDSRFQKYLGNPLHGVRLFFRADGFADTPDGENASIEGSLAGYRAMLAFRYGKDIYNAGAQRPVDKAALEAKLAEAKKISRGEYTDESWNRLQSAITQAEKASTQKEVNLALNVLISAINGLQVKKDEITVSFRLIGDWKHGSSGHTSYVNWIKTRSVKVNKGATVYDAFVKALGEAGLAYQCTGTGYIPAINAPAVFGGYELAEFHNGQGSGWKYMVNGKYPDVGLKGCKIYDGDQIIWRYIDEYRDDFDNDEKWKEAKDEDPSVIFSRMKSEAKAELRSYANLDKLDKEVKAKVEKLLGEANVKIDGAKDKPALDRIVADAKQAIRKLTGSMEETQSEVVDKTTSISLQGEGLTKDMKLAAKELQEDDYRVKAMVKSVPERMILLKTYEIDLTKDGKKIKLPGSAVLSIPVGKEYNGKLVTVVHYHEGEIEKQQAKVEGGMAKIKVSRLSSFAVMLDPEADNEADVVKAMKIKVKSKANRGSIKLSWTTDVSVDGLKYQIYRSVKKNSGFGKKPLFTTKPNAKTYTNTKQLKKGKRYYYKIKAYKMIDGKDVFSDWSNKAYRLAK